MQREREAEDGPNRDETGKPRGFQARGEASSSHFIAPLESGKGVLLTGAIRSIASRKSQLPTNIATHRPLFLHPARNTCGFRHSSSVASITQLSPVSVFNRHVRLPCRYS